ncbi:hypothetical protein BTR14_04300 [Rhizobium rhizosphaerae]|uniref:Uncharacterized protein n=1 Tax=Xaviernesmea rhizosphaerae TaxID=1672749 RepID=A0ABX3PIA5_9HYPH|nr:hypothetical protein BTR14_04300 [Xaviernesmea rhizosphaerae]
MEKRIVTRDVILGLVPRICFRQSNQDVADNRDKPEHDEARASRIWQEGPDIEKRSITFLR